MSGISQVPSMDYGPAIPQSAEASRRLPCRPRRACLAPVAARCMAQGGVTLMAGTDSGGELPRRVPAGPSSPVPSAAPTLSEDLRQRMLAAVKAERAEAAAREQEHAAGNRTTEQPRLGRPPESVTSKEAGPEASSPASGTNGPRNGTAAARLERGAGPRPGNDVTRRPGSVVKPEPAVGPGPVARARTAAGPETAVRPEPDRRRRRAGARLVALGLAIMVIGSLVAVAVEHFSSSPATSATVARQEAAVRVQAAAWVAELVSPDVTVSCDMVMCAALKADGFSAGKLVVLGPASPDPVPSVVVVETAAVRELFGSSLAITWAPTVLASFGSGSSAITVRVVAPHGAAAFQASLNADLVGRKASGAALLRYSRITVSATARSQLVAGFVDSRLLLALALLAGSQPVDIVRFGNLGPGASPGVPLRFADLAENVPAAHMDSAAYARAAWAVLGGVDARVRPARAVSGPVQGQAVLRVEFAAPSPLGKPGSGSS